MIIRTPRSVLSALPSSTRASASPLQQLCIRCASASTTLRPRPIPPPTPFVPNHETFLTLIGRNLKQHSSKIPSWDALFSLSSQQLRDLGVEPARSRKYLLRWRERFRQGVYGIGGDLQHVKEGVGHVRVFEVPVPASWNISSSAVSTSSPATAPGSSFTTSSPTETPTLQIPSSTLGTSTRSAGMRKVALNVPHGSLVPTMSLDRAVPVDHVKIRGSHHIAGKHVELLPGTEGMAAKITMREGLWEERRGHKVDGGERRKAEVRAKRRAAERKAASR